MSWDGDFARRLFGWCRADVQGEVVLHYEAGLYAGPELDGVQALRGCRHQDGAVKRLGDRVVQRAGQSILLGDLEVGQPLRDRLQDLKLALGERVFGGR